MQNTIIVLLAVALAAVRVAGYTCESFQAAAHLFIGYLAGACYVHYVRLDWEWAKHGIVQFVLIVLLSLVELACFIADKMLER